MCACLGARESSLDMLTPNIKLPNLENQVGWLELGGGGRQSPPRPLSPISQAARPNDGTFWRAFRGGWGENGHPLGCGAADSSEVLLILWVVWTSRGFGRNGTGVIFLPPPVRAG